MWVGFNSGASVYDTLIRWWTRGPYSHAELIFSNGDRHTSLPGKGTGWQEPIQIVAGNPIARTDWIVVRVQADEARVREWCTEHIHDWYDWPGIVFSQLFPLKRRASSRYFCSESGTEALQFGYCTEVAQVEPQMVSPNKLYQLVTS